MKKCISVLLLIAMVLGLCACGGGDKEQSETTPGTTAANPTTPAAVSAVEKLNTVSEFSVGYARIDITPQTSVPLAGSTTARISKNILDNLYATAIAIADGQGTAVIWMTIDLQRASNVTVEAVRPLVSMQTGIPESRIIFHGTHTHSGPDLHKHNNAQIEQYKEYLNPRLLSVCLEAIQDLKPAEMYVGSVETESLNFVKHYEYIDENGEKQFFGDHFGTATYNETTKHATDADPTMHLLKFTRTGGKDVIIANWRAHPNSTASSDPESISPDFPGGFRRSMEMLTDCHFAYFNGACGNLNSKSRITTEMRTTDMFEHGHMLAEHALEGLENNMRKIETGPITTKQIVLDQPVNHTMDHVFYKAKELQAMFQATGDYNAVRDAGLPYGIRSSIHAGAIVSNYSRGETTDIELDAIAIGEEFAVVTAPNELFDTLTEQLEEKTPYPMTMFFGYSNGYRGYIPSAYGWEYTCYETDCSWTIPGTGETIRDTFLEMLGELQAAE